MEKISFKNPVIKFFSIGVGLYIVWLLTDEYFLKDNSGINRFLSENLAVFSNGLLHLFNYASTTEFLDQFVIISFSSTRGVWIGEPCNGLKLFALFTIFIIAFPGNWKGKLWFIPLGILIIHIANIIRVAILAIIELKAPEYLNLNHDYTFTILVWSIIFALWYFWVKRFGEIKKANVEV